MHVKKNKWGGHNKNTLQVIDNPSYAFMYFRAKYNSMKQKVS